MRKLIAASALTLGVAIAAAGVHVMPAWADGHITNVCDRDAQSQRGGSVLIAGCHRILPSTANAWS